MVEPELVQAARRVPLPSLLPPDHKLIKKGANKFMALCTLHEETTPSMSLVKYQDGSWGYKCFGCGATGDPIKYIQATQKLDFIDAVKLLTKEAKTAPMRPKIVATYDYLDRNGKFLFQVVRLEPKGFRPRQKTELGWSWCMDGIKTVLYRLPEVLSRPNEVIYYVEGEKDVETLRSHGLLATTHPFGAGAFKSSLLNDLEGKRRIVVIPDNDEPGKACMRKVYKAARDAGHDVGFLLLPNGKDATDYFEQGGAVTDMLKEVK